MENIYLSVVIPAFNEEERIEKTLDKVITYLDSQGYKYEVILVDDGSNDNTVEIGERFAKEKENIYLLKNERNYGKGYSVKKGILYAKGEYILFSDADLSTPIEEVENLLKWIHKGYDITIGSRGLPESNIEVHQSWAREIMGKSFNFIIQSLILKGFWDTQCGFKCFKREIAHNIFKKQRSNGFSFDVEILYIAKKYNYKIKEIPICWRNSPGTKVHIIRDPIKMFMDIIKIKFTDWRGKY